MQTVFVLARMAYCVVFARLGIFVELVHMGKNLMAIRAEMAVEMFSSIVWEFGMVESHDNKGFAVFC
jgi:hypothetical protein